MALELDIQKNLGNFRLDVKLETREQVLALLGASGCGKSMTLKCIAGIETPDHGRIVINGVTLYDSERGINLSPQKRRVGYLFQQYALFPHMTVEQNIAAGVRDKRRAARAVPEVIRAMGLAGTERKRPHQLSGGQQQRVALARILVNEPEILLLDEPFSALDSHLRFRMEQEVRAVIRRFGKDVVLVSHDRDEVFRLADELAIMAEGRVENLGPKRAVFADPGTKNGAILTGCKNISGAKRLSSGTIKALDWNLELTVPEDRPVTAVGIRMHDLRPDGAENRVRGRVIQVVENPFSVTVLFRPPGAAEPLGWETDKETWRQTRAEEVELSLPASALLLLK